MATAVTEKTAIPESITTADELDTTRLGRLSFRDGAPSAETVEKIYDNLDFTRALDAYINGYQLASTQSIHKGLLDAGIEDNRVALVYSHLMDSRSQVLTANADTVYCIFMIDLKAGPMVVETPPDVLGLFNDMWFRNVIDFGLPGPDRGQGGRYLLLPPDYDGSLPDSGFHVAKSSTWSVIGMCRAFMVDNDPQPAADTIKEHLKIYPYTVGGYGTSLGTLLEGKVKPGAPAPVEPLRFVDGADSPIHTIAPSDHTFYDVLNEVVQEQPAAVFSSEIMGSFAAIGIVKGKPFAPDARMKRILADAASVGNATGRALGFRPRETDGWAYYPGSAWYSVLFDGGYDFLNPPPAVTKDGIEPYPPSGYRRLDARFAFFFIEVAVSPAECMRLTDVGSQYLWCAFDRDKDYLDGAKTYRCTLPPNIPENKFWSMTVYDNQTRSMLETAQRFPRAGSQSYPTPATVPNADGSVEVYFGPVAPSGKESNWIQTVPGKGWFCGFRLYNPLQPFFDKSWQIGEIEPVG